MQVSSGSPDGRCAAEHEARLALLAAALCGGCSGPPGGWKGRPSSRSALSGGAALPAAEQARGARHAATVKTAALQDRRGCC